MSQLSLASPHIYQPHIEVLLAIKSIERRQHALRTTTPTLDHLNFTGDCGNGLGIFNHFCSNLRRKFLLRGPEGILDAVQQRAEGGGPQLRRHLRPLSRQGRRRRRHCAGRHSNHGCEKSISLAPWLSSV